MAYKTVYYTIEDLLKHIEIEKGFRVLDLSKGAHGYFTFELAKRVGEEGNVWSLDPDEKVVENIDSLANLYKLYNVKAVKADWEHLEESCLDFNSFDVVLLANILAEIQRHNKLLADIKNLLKNKGHLILLDWKNQDYPTAPTTVLEKEFIKSLLENHYYFIHKELDPGPYHYAFIARKN